MRATRRVRKPPLKTQSRGFSPPANWSSSGPSSDAMDQPPEMVCRLATGVNPPVINEMVLVHWA